ncbi:MAG: hypothetical protein MJB14_22435 [Spirochaetes bacterium]|nr:hypothetical protein [Spirochaetota bacterium]
MPLITMDEKNQPEIKYKYISISKTDNGCLIELGNNQREEYNISVIDTLNLYGEQGFRVIQTTDNGKRYILEKEIKKN